MDNYLTKDILVTAFKECGLKQGDIVLVHSDFSVLGKTEGTIENCLKMYCEALQNVLGDTGTIVVPAYYYEYARKKIPFDIKKSPVSKELGLFSKYINGQKGSCRSLNPLMSLAAIGEKAEYVCGGKTASSCGVDTGFDRLYKAGAKMVFVGVDLSVMTFIHYVEYMVGVPHLYSKYYDIPIYDNGEKIDLPVSAQVRYLDFGIVNDSLSNTEKFEKAGIVKKAKAGKGYIRVVTFEDAFEFLKTKMQKDFFYDLKNKPNFAKDKIPLI